MENNNNKSNKYFQNFLKELTEDLLDNKSYKDFINDNLNITPETLSSYLKDYVVGQDESIDILSRKVATHYKRLRYEILNNEASLDCSKNNILLIGKSGVGKTYMIKRLCNKLGLPYVIKDCTKYSETSFKGEDIENVIRELHEASNYNLPLTELGVVFLDEFDKLAVEGDPNYSTGLGVQKSLLKIIEDSEVNYVDETVMKIQRGNPDAPKYKNVKIKTKNILFIFSGAFEKLTRRNKNNKVPIGFGNQLIPTDNITKTISVDEFVNYGIIRELIGRIPIMIYLSDLNEESLYKILENNNSPYLKLKKREFISYGIELTFTTEALQLIANKAAALGTGARSLNRIIEEILFPIEKCLDLINSSKITITRNYLEEPDLALSKLIDNDLYTSTIKDNTHH
ncbi:MAG: AAA family ATPase [Spirochaetota bacterium]